MLDQFANHGTVGSRTKYGVPKEQMIQAILNIFQAVREQTRDDFLILINAGRSKPTHYTEYVNGSFMEDRQRLGSTCRACPVDTATKALPKSKALSLG